MKRQFAHFLALILVLTAVLLAGTVVRAAKKDAKEEYRLPVFQTSDIHGYLANRSGDDYQYLLAYISDKVGDVRGHGDESRKDLAVLLDAGDIYQGNTMSNLLDGSPLAAAYQIMGYDAVTIGNHEFDWFIENTVDPDCTMTDYVIGEESGVNDVPVVVSNLYRDGEKVDFAKDYVILEKTARTEDGKELPVRIAVIGMAGEYGMDIKYDRFSGAGFTIEPDFARVNEIAASLEESGQCDATILLTHEEAAAIAEGVGEGSVIDLVLGGHTHKNARGKTEWGLNYMQPANNAAYYTYSELSFALTDDGPEFQKVSNTKNVNTKKDPDRLTDVPENAEDLDPELVELTKEVITELDQVLSEEIGYIDRSALRHVWLEGSGERSTSCGNWIISILCRMVGADVGFVNDGALRADFALEKGRDRREITLSDIYMMFPFGNLTCCFEITYEELLECLEFSLTEGGSEVFRQMWGVDCYFTDQTVNAIVTADGLTVYANGKWREGYREKTLLAAVSDFIATKERELDEGPANPFFEWMLTDRLIDASVIDNEGASEVLMEEAAANNGLLTIDDAPHFIEQPHEDIPAEEQEKGTETETSEETGTEPVETQTEEQATTQAEEPESTGEPETPAPETTTEAAPEPGEKTDQAGDGLFPALAVVLLLSAGILIACIAVRRR